MWPTTQGPDISMKSAAQVLGLQNNQSVHHLTLQNVLMYDFAVNNYIWNTYV